MPFTWEEGEREGERGKEGERERERDRVGLYKVWCSKEQHVHMFSYV